jgi:hypothetical protein
MEQFLFEDFNRVIFFIAGRDDGRNLQLFKIYEIWFNRYQKVNNNYNLIKMNRVIEHHHEVEAYFTCFYWSSRFELSYVNKAIDLVLSEIYPNFTVREYLF